MKKIIGILSFFFCFGLIVSLVLGFVLPVKYEIPDSRMFVYKLLKGLDYFYKFLPAILFSGFVVGYSVHFGRNPEGSLSSFSPAMFSRFKMVMVTSLIFVLILTVGNEIGKPHILRKQSSIINQPKLINDYLKVGNNLFENGYYERASRYADAALKLDRNSKAANQLKDKTEEEISRINTSNIRFKLYEQDISDKKAKKSNVDPVSLSNAYENYLRAKECYDNQEWFNAHYYAGIAMKFATEKDPNYMDIKHLQIDAWNKISEEHNLQKSEAEIIYQKKYEGYLALLEENDLRAYYIFNELANSSRELSIDPDVTFYLSIAEKRVKEKYFFIDETFELKTLESANDVYFAYEYKDGSHDIIYFKGMTSVKSTGNSVQYLRNLTVTSVDKDGNIQQVMRVPYAKVLPVSVKDINPISKSIMDIDDSIEFIPYFMLKSVGRDKPNTEVNPEYTDAQGHVTNEPGFMVLPVSYNDFTLFETSPANPLSLSMINLYKVIRKAEAYGFSAAVYTHIFMNRLFYALWLLCMFIFMGTIAWNTRIGLNDYFKMTWVFAFPLIIFVCWIYYEAFMYIMEVINYAIVSFMGAGSAVAVGAVVYICIFIIDVIYFLARRSKV